MPTLVTGSDGQIYYRNEDGSLIPANQVILGGSPLLGSTPPESSRFNAAPRSPYEEQLGDAPNFTGGFGSQRNTNPFGANPSNPFGANVNPFFPDNPNSSQSQFAERLRNTPVPTPNPGPPGPQFRDPGNGGGANTPMSNYINAAGELIMGYRPPPTSGPGVIAGNTTIPDPTAEIAFANQMRQRYGNNLDFRWMYANDNRGDNTQYASTDPRFNNPIFNTPLSQVTAQNYTQIMDALRAIDPQLVRYGPSAPLGATPYYSNNNGNLTFYTQPGTQQATPPGAATPPPGAGTPPPGGTTPPAGTTPTFSTLDQMANAGWLNSVPGSGGSANPFGLTPPGGGGAASTVTVTPGAANSSFNQQYTGGFSGPSAASQATKDAAAAATAPAPTSFPNSAAGWIGAANAGRVPAGFSFGANSGITATNPLPAFGPDWFGQQNSAWGGTNAQAMSRLGYQPGRWTGWGERSDPNPTAYNPTNENMYSIYGNTYASGQSGPSFGPTPTTTTGTNSPAPSRPPELPIGGDYWKP